MDNSRIFDSQKELAEISRKFLYKNGIYEFNNMKISKMNNERVIKECLDFCQKNGLTGEFSEYKMTDKLLLSADGPISLFNVKKEILDKFDSLLDEFLETKTPRCYDETLFVEFLKKKLGNDAITFIKVIGYQIDDEYKNIKYFNF